MEVKKYGMWVNPPIFGENLLQSVDAAYDNVGVEYDQGRIWDAKGFFPCCLRGDTACDVELPDIA